MTIVSDLSDDRLVSRMIAGDEDAFTLLYRRRQPAIYRFALHMSGDSAVAEDVTQEVFMTLIRDARRFDPARGSLAGFLFGVARNHLRKRWEQDRRLVPLLAEPDDTASPGSYEAALGHGSMGSANGNGKGYHPASSKIPLSRDEFTSLEIVSRVRRAIASLPENYREVVILCELEEMSYEEVARALDCPLGTVRSRLHRARAVLLAKLRDAPVCRVSAVGQ
jgi:RNA polymerase sigma-70 factor (ECF subfamily)